MDEGQMIIKKYGSLYEIRKRLMNDDGTFKRKYAASDIDANEGVCSEFLVGYSLLRSDFCDYGNEAADALEPNLLDRIVKAVVAMRFGRAADGEDFNAGKIRLRQILPERVHEKIERFTNEHDWANPADFK
jgi:hypothetical protein